MAIQFSGIDISLVAAEDLSSYQCHFVHQESDTTATLMDNGTEFPVGVLQNAPASGEVAVIRITGTSKLKMNGAVAVGTWLKSEYVGATDCGKGDAADTDGDLARAVCIQASGAEDDLGAVLLCVSKISVT
jgi:hypothetical protein